MGGNLLFDEFNGYGTSGTGAEILLLPIYTHDEAGLFWTGEESG